MQYVSAGPRGDNGGVGKPAGTVAHKFVQEFGLYLVFPNTRFDEAEDPAKALFGNAAGGAHELDFLGFFDPPDFLEEGKAAGHPVGREFGFGGLDEAGVARLGLHGLAVVLVRVEVNGFCLGHQVKKYLVEVGEPVNGLNARNVESLVFVELGPLPYGNVVIGLAQEQYLAVFWVEGLWEQQQDRFFLVYPREVENIALLLEGHGAVGADRVNVIGVENGQAFRGHQGRKLFPVFHKKTGIDLVVFHGLDAFPPKVGNRPAGPKKRGPKSPPGYNGWLVANVQRHCAGRRL